MSLKSFADADRVFLIIYDLLWGLGLATCVLWHSPPINRMLAAEYVNVTHTYQR